MKPDLISKVYGALEGARSAVTWTAVAGSTALFASTAILVSVFDPGGNKTHYVGKAWAMLNLYGIGGRWEVLGLEKMKPGQPYVMMVNHQSHLDIWTIYSALPIQIRWVMKQELRKVPIFGYACERMGHVYVQRGDTESARRSMQEAARRIAAGTTVVFFPEGTRSRGGALGSFKTGGFRLAIQAQVPILPVTIHGTAQMLPADEWRQRPGKIKVVVGQPIPTEGMTLDDMPALMRRTRKAILAGLPLDADAVLLEPAVEATDESHTRKAGDQDKDFTARTG